MTYVMDYDTQRDLLDLARQIDAQCLQGGCTRPRTGTGYLVAGDPGSYCDAHGDAL